MFNDFDDLNPKELVLLSSEYSQYSFKFINYLNKRMNGTGYSSFITLFCLLLASLDKKSRDKLMLVMEEVYNKVGNEIYEDQYDLFQKLDSELKSTFQVDTL